MSGDPGSFRGKIYFELISEIMGESICSEWLAPSAVRHIADELARHTPCRVGDPSPRGLRPYRPG